MFVYWPWIGLIAACALIVAILSIRLAGRVNLRPLDEIRPEQNQVHLHKITLCTQNSNDSNNLYYLFMDRPESHDF